MIPGFENTMTELNLVTKRTRTYGDWTIKYDPQPMRGVNYAFWHENHDGENGLCGTAESVEDAMEQIKEMEE